MYMLAEFEIIAICSVLLGAFWIQFIGGEYPCPLCIIQRMAMVLCALGPAMVIMDGLRSRDIPVQTVLAGYGMSILGAIIGLAAASRQILLHISPGDPGYGSAFMGLHLYSWAFIVFFVVLLFSGVRLMVFNDVRPQRGKSCGIALCAIWLLVLIILANAVAVFCEAGLHWFLLDNPASYRLINGP